ncbi:MAG: carbamoyltransferase HypF [Anaerolineae bacterium]|nr:carbamoyltransferase HypF [Anaerolineae bacterium]
MDDMAPVEGKKRLRVEIKGAVQGVGFRPFVYRLATSLNLAGWVINDTRGVLIEVEGGEASLEEFLRRLTVEKPPRAIIQNLRSSWLEPAGYTRFEIRHSLEQGEKTVLVLPDIATCPDCLAEIFNPSDRRYRYPFTNCTNCGPRFTIIQSLPYDRPNTSMSRFTMCPDCASEYNNPADRRFHAQPNACPLCGPHLELWDAEGRKLASGDEALHLTGIALREGKIVAVKGLGGFHLTVDARNSQAVQRLRERKPRRDKPFALMVRDLEQARLICELTPEAESLLSSPEAPIVLLPRKPGAPVAENVAPGNPNLGIMLPYTPLHHLLLREIDFPIVATSGNLTDEPICTDENEALRRLGPVAELFLIHNRPIVRHVDDSVAWIVLGKPRLLRRARGYAPLPVLLSQPIPPILAVGAHLKNTVALSVGNQVFISQHIGDLETPEAFRAFERVIADFLRLYEVTPAAIAHDLHPDYLSTLWARHHSDIPLIPVQHHHAHLASCLAENQVQGEALGVTWDGTGYGLDGTIWGGEFLLGDASGFRRVAHLRPFRLPGGEVAVREPRRTALALLWEMYGDEVFDMENLPPVASFTPSERKILVRMLERGFNSPVTTSAGRLFDAVSALAGICQKTTFEGQAAMALEFAADLSCQDCYSVEFEEKDGIMLLDWRPIVEGVIRDLRQGKGPGLISARFHNSLVESIVQVALRVGIRKVALSGGCFQNRILTEKAAVLLERKGFQVFLHSQVPPNDGGISLGQIAVAASKLQGKSFGG